jgi:hypothetical protein
MVWVRLDEEFVHHPKVVQVGPHGVALQVAALCYSNRYLTDGFIPFGAVRTLLDFNRVGENVGERQDYWVEVGALNVARKLVEAGLWTEVPGGFRIHDFHDYQPTREAVEAERARNSVAGKRSGEARRSRGRQRTVEQSGERSVERSVEQSVGAIGKVEQSVGVIEHSVERSVDTVSNENATQGQPVPVPVPVPVVERHVSDGTRADARSAESAKAPTAKQLTAEYVAKCKARPPKPVIDRTGREVAKLLDEGVDPAAIRAGLELLRVRAKHPSLLAALVNEHLNPPSRNGVEHVTPPAPARCEHDQHAELCDICHPRPTTAAIPDWRAALATAGPPSEPAAPP